MSHMIRNALLTASLVLASNGIASAATPPAEPAPTRVEGVEAASCVSLDSRIKKRRCEETERKHADVRRSQGDLGDILQDDTAQGSALNQTFND